MHRLQLVSLFVLAGLVACTPAPVDPGEDDPTEEDPVQGTIDPLEPGAPTFGTCNSAPLPAATSNVDWEHTATELLMLADPDPDHSAQDVLVTDAVTAHIVGKFAYGTVSKDLEDEWVEVWLDDCSGSYVFVGEAKTDSDGRVSVAVPDDLLPGYGRFATFSRVQGDQSYVASELRVYPTGTALMVSDIDGTLTTSDMELFNDLFSDLFEPLFGGSYVPEARADAVETMWLRDDQGYELVYLSGRPYYLGDITHEWLDDEGFPEGTVHIIDGTADALPTNDAVGEFKRTYLASLLEMGFEIQGAYGNATTDIYAYGRAPVAADRIWIAGKHGGEAGTVAVGDDYVEHYAEAAAEPDVEQPFVELP